MSGLKVFFSHGFRPFFFGAGLWAAISILIWLATNSGHGGLPETATTLNWHIHTMLSGYVSAVVAGFLLTAVPNWTGTEPVRGGPLVGLFLLWAVGRLVTLFADSLPAVVVGVIDLSFLVGIVAVTAPVIVRTNNRRNLVVIVLVALIWFGQLLRHIGTVLENDIAELGGRLGLAAILLLIVLIGGRVVPAFSRNWFRAQQINAVPPEFNRVDQVSVLVALAALLLWTFEASKILCGIAFFAACFAHSVRLWRWRGWQSAREPLVLVMHIAYLWLPIGFGLMGASLIFDTVPQTVALHALTVGGIGTITLAIMTRATLGHSGRALTANALTSVIYLLISLSAVLRVVGPVLGDPTGTVLVAGLAWEGAFILFLIGYGPLVWRPRVD